MLDYEWGNPSAMMIPGEDPDQTHHGPDPTRPDMLSHYGSSHPGFSDHFMSSNNPHHGDLSDANSGHQAFGQHHFALPHAHHHQPLHHQLYDPRAYGGYAQHSMLSLHEGAGPGAQYVVVPKSEECRPGAADELMGASRIGLNLGGRTYFSSAEDDFMSRLYRRPRALDGAGHAANSPRCQAEGCNADLSHAKHYHRRHKVCEFHSKASTVIAAGLTQRFCQQCSRFHLLSEFDNGKRSCRKRLADHNRRRRKTQQQPNQEILKSSSSLSNVPTMDRSVSRSPPDSGAPSSSSVTVAVSPPRMSLDCFRQRSTYNTTASSGSSSSLFFSSG